MTTDRISLKVHADSRTNLILTHVTVREGFTGMVSIEGRGHARHYVNGLAIWVGAERILRRHNPTRPVSVDERRNAVNIVAPDITDADADLLLAITPRGVHFRLFNSHAEHAADLGRRIAAFEARPRD